MQSTNKIRHRQMIDVPNEAKIFTTEKCEKRKYAPSDCNILVDAVMPILPELLSQSTIMAKIFLEMRPAAKGAAVNKPFYKKNFKSNGL